MATNTGRPHPNTKHGMSNSPEWKCWRAMKARCLNPNNPAFSKYGGSGRTLCERWKDFQCFLEDIGPRPSELHTIERIDNEKGYEPANVRWATYTEQNRNRRGNKRLTLNGETLTYSAWAERLGISLSTIQGRVRMGWTDEEVLTKASRPFCLDEAQNKLTTALALIDTGAPEAVDPARENLKDAIRLINESRRYRDYAKKRRRGGYVAAQAAQGDAA